MLIHDQEQMFAPRPFKQSIHASNSQVNYDVHRIEAWNNLHFKIMQAVPLSKFEED